MNYAFVNLVVAWLKINSVIHEHSCKILFLHILGMNLIPGENIPILMKKKKKKEKSRLNKNLLHDCFSKYSSKMLRYKK